MYGYTDTKAGNDAERTVTGAGKDGEGRREMRCKDGEMRCKDSEMRCKDSERRCKDSERRCKDSEMRRTRTYFRTASSHGGGGGIPAWSEIANMGHR